MQKETKEAIVALAQLPGWSADRIVKAFTVSLDADVVRAAMGPPKKPVGRTAVGVKVPPRRVP